MARNREACTKLAESGDIRLNGQRVDRAHRQVRIGDVLTIAFTTRVLVMKVTGLAERRGSAPEAQELYELL